MDKIIASFTLNIYECSCQQKTWEGKDYKVYKAVTNKGLIDMSADAYEAYAAGVNEGYAVDYNPNNGKIKVVLQS